MVAEQDPAQAADGATAQRGLRFVSAFDMPLWHWQEEDQAFVK